MKIARWINYIECLRSETFQEDLRYIKSLMKAFYSPLGGETKMEKEADSFDSEEYENEQ